MALIGISGKIRSGKDTIGDIIQYLTREESHQSMSYNIWQELKVQNASSWQIKKFADALKEIVCILIGCTREQLENIDFKNSKLSPDWGKIIDGVATTYTVREALQIIGTDMFRKHFHANTWANALFSKYTSEYKNDPWYDNKGLFDVSKQDELENPTMFPNWIITDVRFPNEANEIRIRDGLLIRVNRPTDSIQSAHPSETSLDNYQFDYVIENDGTIEDLVIEVSKILQKERIIL